MFLWMVLALVFVVAIAATPTARNVSAKLRTYVRGVKYMVVSKDLPSKFHGTNFLKIPGAPVGTNRKRVVRLIFIRHGQSVWNSVFNSFNFGWPVRAVKTIVKETVLFFTNPLDSTIIDSPLSKKGQTEAEELRDFVRAAKGRMPMDTSTSTVVCSNLRRAMATALIGLQPRLAATRERIVMDSSLQEGSRNIDAQSFSTHKGKIALSPVHNLDTAVMLHAAFDPCLNAGNKPVHSNVFSRMDEFVTHLFSPSGLQPSVAGAGGNEQLTDVIVVGHSGWFRQFFKRFLPSTSQCVAKSKKMKNCAAVAFNLVRDENTGEIFIDEASLEILHRGF